MVMGCVLVIHVVLVAAMGNPLGPAMAGSSISLAIVTTFIMSRAQISYGRLGAQTELSPKITVCAMRLKFLCSLPR